MAVDFRYFPALSIPGGTTGQVLTKTSSAPDNAGQWADPAVGIGPIGPTGAAGPVGPAGAAGTPGLPGADGAGLKSFRATGVTDGSGNATFNLTPAAFASAPVVTAIIQAAGSNNPIDYRITAVTATSVTVNVRQSSVLIILSLSVLGVSSPLAGVTVHMHAMPSGSQI